MVDLVFKLTIMTVQAEPELLTTKLQCPRKQSDVIYIVCVWIWYICVCEYVNIYVYACVHAKSLQSCPTLVTLWTVALQAPLSMGFCRQEYYSGLPSPPPGDLPDPGIEPMSHYVSCIAVGFFITSATWEAHIGIYIRVCVCGCAHTHTYFIPNSDIHKCLGWHDWV